MQQRNVVATGELEEITLLRARILVADYGRPRSRYGYATPQEVCFDGHKYALKSETLNRIIMSCDEPRHQAAMEQLVTFDPRHRAAMEQLVTFDTSGSPTDRDHHESALRGTRYKATIFKPVNRNKKKRL